MDIVNGVVEELCYLGDMLSVLLSLPWFTVVGWSQWPLSSSPKMFPCCCEEKFMTCDSCMLHGSETWSLKRLNELALHQTDENDQMEMSGYKLSWIELSRDVVLEASASARGSLEAVFFSWLGLTRSCLGLDLTASALPHSFCLGLG